LFFDLKKNFYLGHIFAWNLFSNYRTTYRWKKTFLFQTFRK
jgi:hypothetical protein